MVRASSPVRLAASVRRLLRDKGSAERAAGAQRYFKGEIRSRGWRTADLRRQARSLRNEILPRGFDLLLDTASLLFRGSVLDEKTFAVFLLEGLHPRFGDREFQLFGSWLDRVTSWADHDALVHYLIAPMIPAKPARRKTVFLWAVSTCRWHRRAACVALVRATRANLFFPEIQRLAGILLHDPDDMVRKGLGWLLRETAKSNPRHTVPYLMSIRRQAPKLVLRTACETLSPSARRRILIP